MIPHGLRNLAKKTLGVLPPSFPSLLYNKAAKIPLARSILKACVKLLIPPFIQIEEGKIILDRTDAAVSGALALGSFETFETEIFRKAIKSGMNIVDVGAQIGYYTVIFGTRTGISGKVFAFEPEKHNYSILLKNIEANELRNVTAINKAVADSAGDRELFLQEDNKGHHSFANNKTKNKSSNQVVMVEMDTLDNMLRAYGSPIIDILKIDIEGAEPIALRGMRDTIARSPDMILFTEVYPLCMEKLGESPVKYLQELRTLGFKLSSIDETKKVLLPINDIPEFIESIPKGESFKNICATKKAN